MCVFVCTENRKNNNHVVYFLSMTQAILKYKYLYSCFIEIFQTDFYNKNCDSKNPFSIPVSASRLHMRESRSSCFG